jgi:Arc/MetJ-type ribon-helix-helix transcriptional regulator
MVNLSAELEAEIRRRAAESEYPSLDALIREALEALDRERGLESLLLEGLEGPETPVTPETIAEIREAGLARLREIRGG